ncbi:hypothetical protein AGMMS50230_10780 [Spirochaetia bacterium]|nr:hypothetical protein AGMMS50230_10780 [Spirochaetia bacterium]
MTKIAKKRVTAGTLPTRRSHDNLEKRSPFSVLRSPFSVLRSPLQHGSLIRQSAVRITLFLILVVLSSCGNLTDGGTTLTLLVSGKSVAYTPGSGPDDPSQLTYTIHGSGPGILTKTVQGGGSITLSLVPGNWTIQVTASYQGIPYAESEPQSVNVQAGGNNTAPITIGPAWSAGNSVDFGGGTVTEYKYFSAASDAATNALDAYLSGLGAGNYVVIVDGTHTISPRTLAGTVSLRGSGTLKLATNGSMFTVNATTAKLILRGVKLEGLTTNTASLVSVSYGTLEMYDGSAISGNYASNGGGVLVGSGTFIMSGGTINGNTSVNGAGVYVSGAFTMSGSAVISGNTALSHGGGVFVNVGGTFTMSGGTIYGSSGDANSNYAASGGYSLYNNGTATNGGLPITNSDSHITGVP